MTDAKRMFEDFKLLAEADGFEIVWVQYPLREVRVVYRRDGDDTEREVRLPFVDVLFQGDAAQNFLKLFKAKVAA